MRQYIVTEPYIPDENSLQSFYPEVVSCNPTKLSTVTAAIQLRDGEFSGGVLVAI